MGEFLDTAPHDPADSQTTESHQVHTDDDLSESVCHCSHNLCVSHHEYIPPAGTVIVCPLRSDVRAALKQQLTVRGLPRYTAMIAQNDYLAMRCTDLWSLDLPCSARRTDLCSWSVSDIRDKTHYYTLVKLLMRKCVCSSNSEFPPYYTSCLQWNWAEHNASNMKGSKSTRGNYCSVFVAQLASASVS